MLQVAGSWVVAPAAGRSRGTVHFLGGAFAGAAPQVAYSLLLQLLAEAGYTCVATPYAVTFQHLICASAVQQARPSWPQRCTCCCEGAAATPAGRGSSTSARVHQEVVSCLFALLC